jgi:hypothetical protein
MVNDLAAAKYSPCAGKLEQRDLEDGIVMETEASALCLWDLGATPRQKRHTTANCPRNLSSYDGRWC